MPLHTADKNQTPECHCGQFDEVEDDWWDLGNVGPMIAFFIGLTCLVIACGFLP
jgi:hypothetical protein